MRIAAIARLIAVLFLSTAFLAPAAQAAGVKMEFFGNQHFRLTSPSGKVILINPWVRGNRDAGVKVEDYKKGDVDLILATSGHGDDQGNAVEIAARTGAKIFTVAELGRIMMGQIGKFGGKKSQIYLGSISGRMKLGGITVQIMNSQHGSGARPPKGHPGPMYGGPASGYMITFENGLRVYMAGSTGLTMDLQLYGMRYKPHVAMLPIAGRFMMHPDDAAYAAKLLMTDNPNLKTVIPQHHRYKGRPPWMGTPDQFEAEIKKLGLPLKVIKVKPGAIYTLSR